VLFEKFGKSQSEDRVCPGRSLKFVGLPVRPGKPLHVERPREPQSQILKEVPNLVKELDEGFESLRGAANEVVVPAFDEVCGEKPLAFAFVKFDGGRNDLARLDPDLGRALRVDGHNFLGRLFENGG